MPKITLKKNSISLSIISLLLTGLILLTYYQYNMVIKASQNINNEINKLNQRNLTSQNLRDNLLLIKETQKETSQYNNFIFQSGFELQIITDLETIAHKNNVTQKITASNLDNYNQNKIDLTINLTGQYKDLLQYLSDIEAYNNLIIINRIEFQPSGQLENYINDSLAILRVNLSLYARN